MIRFQLKNVRRITTIVAAGLICLTFASPVRADDFDDQINALQQEISAQQAQVDVLKNRQSTLQGELNAINAQISATLAAQRLTQAKLDKVNADLESAKQKMQRQKDALAENVKLLYQQSSVSSLEVLASSDNFSDFLDRQQYLHQFRDKIEDTLTQIAQLRAQLDEQKQQLNVLAEEQRGLQASLTAQRTQSANLLAQTRGEEANYQRLIADNNAKLAAVVAARAEAVRRGQLSISSGGCGGYPSIWCDTPQDSRVDNWGGLNRECVSYVNWKRYSLGLTPQPYWWGHAYMWMSHVTHYSNPRYGDIIVWGQYANPYVGWAGHVAFVEAVSGNTITLSQFNFDVGDGPGRYSRMTVNLGDTFMRGAAYIAGN